MEGPPPPPLTQWSVTLDSGCSRNRPFPAPLLLPGARAPRVRCRHLRRVGDAGYMNVVLNIKVHELRFPTALLAVSGCHEGLVTRCEVQSPRNSEGALPSRAGPLRRPTAEFHPSL